MNWIQSFRTGIKELNRRASRVGWLFILISAVLIFLLVRAYQQIAATNPSLPSDVRTVQEQLDEQAQRIAELEAKIAELENKLNQ